MLGPLLQRPFVCGVATLALYACTGAAQRFPLQVRSAADAAGSIQIERIEGGEQLVVIELWRLPPPEELTPGARAFVVWLQAAEHPMPVRAGALSYDPVTRSGNLIATAPAASFVVRITSEASAEIERPSDVLVAERAIAFN